MPDHYVKSLLADQEQVFLTTRRHWFVFFRSIVFELIFAAAIIILVTVLMTMQLGFPFGYGYLLLIIPLVSLYRDYVVWKSHEYIITNRRVMQISGIFNKNVIDSSLEKVNDVKMNQPFLGRIFNFGDIEILTASELGVNLFQTIGDPVRFKTTMLNAKEGLALDHDHYAVPGAAAAPHDIPTILEELDQLRQRGILSEEEFQRKKQDLIAKM